MLRCVKWLPFACLGLFVLFACLGYALKSGGKKLDYEYTPRFYDIHGKRVQDAALYDEHGGPYDKKNNEWLQGAQEPSLTFRVKVGATARFRERSVTMQWHTRDAFLKWLDTGFTRELTDHNANMRAWEANLKELRDGAGPAGGYYPIILDAK